MSMKRSEELPVGLERVRLGLATWREQRRGRERIPERLWEAAARAAGEYGVHRVSRALGLDYNHLKQRAGVGAGTPAMPRSPGPVFVDVGGARPDAGLACVVELEKGNGTRMRICVREAAGVDWGKLKEAFLGA